MQKFYGPTGYFQHAHMASPPLPVYFMYPDVWQTVKNFEFVFNADHFPPFLLTIVKLLFKY